MKNFRHWISILPTCVLMLSVHAAFGQSQPPPMSSAASSPSSGTRATEAEKIVSACAAAAEDLAKQRLLADALDHENELLRQRLETERATTTLLAELNKTRAGETAALRSALAAKDETIAAKEAVIASQRTMVETLKRKRSSPWKRITDVLIGAAVFAIFK